MNEKMDRIKNGLSELNDDQLDTVVGGYSIGDKVLCSYDSIRYCPGCGRLLKNFEVTIDGVVGKMYDGTMVYEVTYSCCGRKTREGDRDFLG